MSCLVFVGCFRTIADAALVESAGDVEWSSVTCTWPSSYIRTENRYRNRRARYSPTTKIVKLLGTTFGQARAVMVGEPGVASNWAVGR